MENKAKLKGYKLNPNYTPSAGDYLHIADWDYGEIEELVAMTPKGWWYNYHDKINLGFAGYEILLFIQDTFGTAAAYNIPWGTNHITKSDILVPVEEAPVYSPENIVVTWGDVVIEDFSDVVFIPQHKKEKPELKYTELWVADTSNDMMGVMSGYLTHGKYYEVLSTHTNHFGGLVFKVVNETGYIAPYGACWFKPVRLYDEDESELICRDGEFVEGDYIDLRKHTPEQIRHIAEFFQFYNLKDLLSNLETNSFIYWDSDGEFVGTGDISKFYRRQDEYTYDDIFYSEES